MITINRQKIVVRNVKKISHTITNSLWNVSVYISGTTAGQNNTCGGSFTLAPRSTENVTLLVSKDRLPRGYCEVTVGINNSQRCRRQICVQGAGALENTGMIFKFTPSPSGQTVDSEVGLYLILRFSFFFWSPSAL